MAQAPSDVQTVLVIAYFSRSRKQCKGSEIPCVGISFFSFWKCTFSGYFCGNKVFRFASVFARSELT